MSFLEKIKAWIDCEDTGDDAFSPQQQGARELEPVELVQHALNTIADNAKEWPDGVDLPDTIELWISLQDYDYFGPRKATCEKRIADAIVLYAERSNALLECAPTVILHVDTSLPMGKVRSRAAFSNPAEREERASSGAAGGRGANGAARGAAGACNGGDAVQSRVGNPRIFAQPHGAQPQAGHAPLIDSLRTQMFNPQADATVLAGGMGAGGTAGVGTGMGAAGAGVGTGTGTASAVGASKAPAAAGVNAVAGANAQAASAAQNAAIAADVAATVMQSAPNADAGMAANAANTAPANDAYAAASAVAGAPDPAGTFAVPTNPEPAPTNAVEPDAVAPQNAQQPAAHQLTPELKISWAAPCTAAKLIDRDRQINVLDGDVVGCLRQVGEAAPSIALNEADHPYVSQKQATFTCQGDTWFLTSFGRNGTSVQREGVWTDLQKGVPYELRNGDRISFARSAPLAFCQA